jgi:hypothetical protein
MVSKLRKEVDDGRRMTIKDAECVDTLAACSSCCSGMQVRVHDVEAKSKLCSLVVWSFNLTLCGS